MATDQTRKRVYHNPSRVCLSGNHFSSASPVLIEVLPLESSLERKQKEAFMEVNKASNLFRRLKACDLKPRSVCLHLQWGARNAQLNDTPWRWFGFDVWGMAEWKRVQSFNGEGWGLTWRRNIRYSAFNVDAWINFNPSYFLSRNFVKDNRIRRRTVEKQNRFPRWK